MYRNNWEPVIGEVLKTCMESQNEVHKYAVAVVDNENNIHWLFTKRKKWKICENTILLFESDPLNICYVKITGNAVNFGDDKGMRSPCLLQFTENCKMMKILQELINKLL